MSQKVSNRKFWIGTLVGGVVGGVTALLFAPKAGRELRQDIADGAKQASEKTQQLAQQIGDRTTSLIDTAKEKTVGLKRTILNWQEGRSAVDEDQLEVATVSSETVFEAIEPSADNLVDEIADDIVDESEHIAETSAEEEKQILFVI
ncbi:YtxH domain-containing protein [Paenibacillus marinisediminis]